MYRYAKWLPTVILFLLVILELYGGGVDLSAVFLIWLLAQSLALVPTASYYIGRWWGERTSESRETDAAEAGVVEPESQWWLAHFFVTVGLILLLVTIVMSISIGGATDAIFAGMMLTSVIVVFFGFIGVIGYFYDAKALKAADASWQPNPWVWVVVGFIFGHVFLMPIYLARRWWTVGLDWSKLPLIGSGDGTAG
jgi:hypothetical protein